MICVGRSRLVCKTVMTGVLRRSGLNTRTSAVPSRGKYIEAASVRIGQNVMNAGNSPSTGLPDASDFDTIHAPLMKVKLCPLRRRWTLVSS